MESKISLKKFTELHEKYSDSSEYYLLWTNETNSNLFLRLKTNIHALKMALIDGDKNEAERQCSHIANYAMMIADNIRKNE